MSHIKKFLVSLKLKFKPVAELIIFARNVVKKMTESIYFSAPGVVINPPLSEVTDATDELEEAAAQAENGGELETSEMHNRETDLQGLLTRLGHFVEDFASLDNENAKSIILSAGMDVKKAGELIGPLPAPGNLSATAVEVGSIDLNCNRVIGARAYIFRARKTSGPRDAWFLKGDMESLSTKSKFTWTGLQSREEYDFQVAAIGAAGRGAWSDIARSSVL